MEAAEKLKDNIEFPGNENELLESLSKIVTKRRMVSLARSNSGVSEQRRFLKRNVSLEKFRLRSEDGCRVETVAEAFPVILDIVRERNDTEEVVDQSGQKLRELRDFKIHLSNPTSDRIPSFYRDDAESLEKYFEEEFVKDGGLFSSQLLRDNQLGAVIKNLASIINGDNNKIGTRRAILVIPHEVREDLTPLGLVSVQIMPRHDERKINLHYLYNWRTVDVLVGLPYSLYASVRLSEHLAELIKKEVSAGLRDRLHIGEISYNAGSLHMFLDDYGQGIARRIVDESSY